MQTSVLVRGLVFSESPRWHDDALWFVDMYGGTVGLVDLEGACRIVATFNEALGGLGFLPDGMPLVVLRDSCQLIRLKADGPVVHCELVVGRNRLSDMVVDACGRAYVSSRAAWPANIPRGYSAADGDYRASTVDVGDSILVVEPDGTAALGASGDLLGPNGLAIAADGKSLIVAEARGRRVTAFAIEGDGSLGTRRAFAVDVGYCDGLCLDAEGAAWIGSAREHRFNRIAPGGELLDSIDLGPKWAVACALGGPDRRTLFMTTASLPPEAIIAMDYRDCSEGFVEAVTVSVPGAGIP